MIVVGSNTKCCATCALWDGERKPNFAFVLHNGKPGRCYRIDKVMGLEMVPFSTCSDWKKWPPLH